MDTNVNTDELIKDCIKQFPGMDYYQVQRYLQDKGVREDLIPMIIDHAQYVESRIAEAKQKIITGIGLSIVGWASILVFLFADYEGWYLIMYGAAAIGLVMIIWGVNMLKETKHYR